MLDPISPPTARRPEETVELVSAALSDGDLEAVLAQYERGAVLQPWAAGAGCNGGSLRDTIADLMALRLPLSATVHAVLASGDLALVLGKREIAGTGPASERVRLQRGGFERGPAPAGRHLVHRRRGLVPRRVRPVRQSPPPLTAAARCRSRGPAPGRGVHLPARTTARDAAFG